MTLRTVPPELLVNRRGGRGRQLQVVVPQKRRAPAVPAECRTQHAREVWRRFWRHPVSAAVEWDADYEPLRHWILAVDERERLRPLLENAPVIQGGNSRLVLNPLARRVDRLTADIDRFCDKFGLTPAARFQLQITYAEAGKAGIQLARERRREMVEAPTAVTPEVLDLDAAL
jgi:P27 family predicted phage terminase small subunit